MSHQSATLPEIFAVARAQDLTPEEKTLWTLYRSFDFNGQGAFPSDDTLASHLGKASRTVRRYRARLLELGYLVQELRGPRPPLYHPVVPPAEAERVANPGRSLSTMEAEGRPDPALQEPERVATVGRPKGKGWPSVTQRVANRGHRSTVVNTEQLSSVSSLRSDPGGVAPGLVVENSGDPDPVPHLLGVLREVAWRGSPGRREEARDRELLQLWLSQGISSSSIETAVRGFARMVEDGRVKWIPAGFSWTARALKSTGVIRDGCVIASFPAAQDYQLEDCPGHLLRRRPSRSSLSRLGEALHTAMAFGGG